MPDQDSHEASLAYINPGAPRVSPPSYPGTYYDAVVPATLDLAERARLCVNALTATTDPACDDELYWIVDLLAREPVMYHTVDDHVQAKFFQALPLNRIACGSTQNLEVEHRLLQTHLRMQGPDGLIYLPIPGRPWALPAEPNPWAGLDYLPAGEHWCSVSTNGRILGGFGVYALIDPTGPWAAAAQRLARGLIDLCVVEDDVAYLAANCTEPGRPVTRPAARPIGLRAAIAGWVAQGLAQYGRFLGDDEASAMAARLMRYIMRDSGYFQTEGEFGREFPGSRMIHFHAHTCQIMSALEVVQATGDDELLGLARQAYDYAVSEGEPLLGFFPEWLTCKGGAYGEGQVSSEICEVADMITAGLKLSLLGVDRWDEVDRWVRNQFSECQLIDTSWLTDGHLEPVDRARSPLPGAGCSRPEYGTTDRVLERALGSFSGWPSANDLVQGDGWSIMHCCTGNAARALYYVWEQILTAEPGRLRVNLLLNRASPWVDLHSHIPFQGLVEVVVKQDLELEIRLAEWVRPEEARCTVNGALRDLTFAGRYARVGRVSAGERVTLAFPIRERTDRVIVEKRPYTLVRRGNEVVWIDPPGRNRPLYQRGHYRQGETLWRTVRRFTSNTPVSWC
ncbi:MAG: hypothetical protein WDA75_10100 [Candidatus Latescibacterota bacterium]|jgi:hypothetical protein